LILLQKFSKRDANYIIKKAFFDFIFPSSSGLTRGSILKKELDSRFRGNDEQI